MADRFRGTLVGVATGDGLGAPFEGLPHVPHNQIAAILDADTPLRYTDDTHMTIGLAEHFVVVGGFDGARLAATWAANFNAEPWRGYGPGPGQVFAHVDRGVPWDQAGLKLHGGSGSWGNGAAMRVAPAALLGFGDVDRVAALARQTAMITHAHPLGIEGAVLQAVAIALLLQQPADTSLDASSFLEELRKHIETDEYTHALATIPALLPGGPNEGAPIYRVLGNGIAAFESVPTALYCFLRHQDDVTDALTFAIGLGGDTDTIAAMTGALVGARLGESRIPERSRNRVEGVDRLRSLANDLRRLAAPG